MAKRAAILGTVGVPANYGGFETLADNLVIFHDENDRPVELTVYCSAKSGREQPKTYRKANLRYIDFEANGVQSIIYDIASLFDAVRRGHDRLLLLGVSGAVVLPLIRLFSSARIITNVDGIEWKREKWKGLAKFYLRLAEAIAVRFSHDVIADNQAIAEYLQDSYGCDAHVIPYGGDHAVEAVVDESAAAYLPKEYALGLCRIEPENNVNMILEAFDTLAMPLVFVGNWENSAYGRALKARYSDHPSIIIHDPIYDASALRGLRERATLYLHGHSAGGTNPALVEMMHFGIPIIAHNCSFNRHTTENEALYFGSVDELRMRVGELTGQRSRSVGVAMSEIAGRRYRWSKIGQSYFKLLEA